MPPVLCSVVPVIAAVAASVTPTPLVVRSITVVLALPSAAVPVKTIPPAAPFSTIVGPVSMAPVFSAMPPLPDEATMDPKAVTGAEIVIAPPPPPARKTLPPVDSTGAPVTMLIPAPASRLRSPALFTAAVMDRSWPAFRVRVVTGPELVSKADSTNKSRVVAIVTAPVRPAIFAGVSQESCVASGC